MDSEKRISELKFYEIKKCKFIQESVRQKNERKLVASANCKRKSRTKAERDKALEVMKAALKEGKQIKVAVIEAGYEINQGMWFFRRRTGKTMTEYKNEHRNESHQTSAAKDEATPATLV